MMDRRTFLAGTAATAALPVAARVEADAEAEASLSDAFDRIERAVTELQQVLLDNSADAFPAVHALGRAIGSYSMLIRQRPGQDTKIIQGGAGAMKQHPEQVLWHGDCTHHRCGSPRALNRANDYVIHNKQLYFRD